MVDYLSINKEAWEKRTKVHVESEFYDVNAFIKGKSSLHSIELNEVGNVEGKRLLHLQCHFGQDTLSWAQPLGLTQEPGEPVAHADNRAAQPDPVWHQTSLPPASWWQNG